MALSDAHGAIFNFMITDADRHFASILDENDD
jgi:hypothetical protein